MRLKLFVLLGLAVILIFTTPSKAQVPAKVENATTVLDTDGDRISDELDACPKDVGPMNSEALKNGCTAHALARQWIVAFISKVSFPGRKTYFTHAQETREEALVRYGEIANDLLAAVYDPDVKPLFSGPLGRARTISLMLGVMFWETGFRRDVDFGLGKHARGDNGRSWCLMQINIGSGKTASGFTGEDLVKNRRACFQEGLRVIRGSFSACRRLPLEHRLSAYASGSCDKGRDKSRQRVHTGMQWFSNSRALRLFSDNDLAPQLPAPTPDAHPNPSSDRVSFLSPISKERTQDGPIR